MNSVHSGIDVKGNDVPSVSSLLVVEEVTISSGCVKHWLATGRASDFKFSTPIIPHGMYFPSTPLPSSPFLSCLRRAWWDGVEQDIWRWKV